MIINEIYDLTKIIGSISIIIAITYFLFSIGLYRYINLTKTELEKTQLLSASTFYFAVIIMLLFIIVTFIKILIINDISTINFYIKIGAFNVIEILIALFIYFESFNIIYKKKSEIESNKIYKTNSYLYKKYKIYVIVCLVMSSIFIGINIIFTEMYNKAEAISTFELIVCFYLYTTMIIICGNYYICGELHNLKNYIIKLDSNNEILGYIISENKDEIMMKSGFNMPIFIKKSSIISYQLAYSEDEGNTKK